MNKDQSNQDVQYMRRCIQLARNGEGTCSPNPKVGALLVYNHTIIGEGWHRKAGEPHAEPNAIHSVREKELISKSTLYVTLEPCSHVGKTPPCVDLILKMRIPRVVIGTLDPNPLVSGRGIEKLRASGVEVLVGVETEKCHALNAPYFDFFIEKRPRIILKWAQTSDGFIDGPRRGLEEAPPLKISSDFTSMLAHKLRSECDAILVGTQTAWKDNPKLNVRNWFGNDPLRCVIDKERKLPSHLHLFDGSIPTVVFTEKSADSKDGIQWKSVPFDTNFLTHLLDELYGMKKMVLLVEGGAKLLQSFLDQNLWDEVYFENGPLQIGRGVKAPSFLFHDPICKQTYTYGSGENCRQIRHFVKKQKCKPLVTDMTQI